MRNETTVTSGFNADLDNGDDHRREVELLKEELYKKFKKKQKKKEKQEKEAQDAGMYVKNAREDAKHAREEDEGDEREEADDANEDEDEDNAEKDNEANGDGNSNLNPQSKKRISGKMLKSMESIYRTTSRNHLDLSRMADNKAHIMIQVNAIIVSLVVSLFLRKIDSYTNLLIPIGIMLISCLTTIVFAVLATRPKITRGTFTEKDLLQGRTNLLFFGNFYKSTLNEYDWGMRELINNPDLLYSSIVEDIYYLGKVLAHKYRLIRVAYTVFLYGFVIAVLSFILALFVHSLHT